VVLFTQFIELRVAAHRLSLKKQTRTGWRASPATTDFNDATTEVAIPVGPAPGGKSGANRLENPGT
jgi:hypothetical protein